MNKSITCVTRYWVFCLNEKKKICFIGWADHVHLERWAGYFPELDYDVTVISYSGRGVYPDSVTQYCLKDFPLASFKLRHLYLRYLLWRIAPDVVHIHYAGFLASVRNAWHGPLVVTAWGSDIYRLQNQSEIEKDLIRQGLSDADVITCDSVDLGVAIEAFSPGTAAKVSVIQWGVDTKVFNNSEQGSELAVELGITDRPVVISPRNFLPLYRLDDIVKAMRIVLDTTPDAVLLMKRYNQDEDYSADIEALINELGMGDSVIILERVDYNKMADFYRAGQVMVSVPETDGTPMSLLESMACGCPPVVSDLPSVREWITNEENGFLVANGDVEALATAIIRLLEDRTLASKIISNNLSLVEDKASQASNMRLMDKAYRSLIGTVQ